jgi:hypothetical protein
LHQGLSLLPVTDEFFDAVGDGSPDMLGLWHLPGGFGCVLATWSKTGPGHYVDTSRASLPGSPKFSILTWIQLSVR